MNSFINCSFVRFFTQKFDCLPVLEMKDEEHLKKREEVDFEEMVKQKGNDNKIDVKIPQFRKVPLEKIFTSQRPMQIHPQMRRISQGSVSEYASQFSPNLHHLVHPDPELREASLVTEHQTAYIPISTTSITELTDKPTLDFMLYYDFQKCSLTVTLIQATNLPAKDKSGTSDPYVTLFLLPHREDIYRSKTHYKTLNPIFNESFTFEGMQYSEVMERTLVLHVFDEDKISKNDNIGTIVMPLHKTELHGVRVAAVLNEESSITQVMIISNCLCACMYIYIYISIYIYILVLF